MKSKLLITTSIVILASVSAGFLIRKNYERSDNVETRAMLVMRVIGHKILLHAGDSTSRVLPVKKVSPSVFQLEFQSPFNFVPDTLVSVVHASLASAKLPLQYTVNVFDCSTKEIIYGYQIAEKASTLVPCLGREQTKGCYVIQIVFLEDLSNDAIIGYLVISSAAFAMIAFVLIGRAYIIKGRKDPLPMDEGTFITLGKYVFSSEKRLLRVGQETLSLTDKESKLLSVLSTSLNQPVDRDKLMKEVWEDDGVFVGRSLDVFISKLRKKFQQDKGIRIVSIHGKGYKLEID